MSSNNMPLLICLTATRNYGWCTKAFLEGNSIWADYIIVVDQMSTDNTRELCAQYEKVIVVDNTDLSYSETVRCTLAINKAREIPGDKIFIYLAIDEVLSANALTSNDWTKMLKSKPSEVGLLKWANVCEDGRNYIPSNKPDGTPYWMARVFHDDGVTPYDNDGLDMHTHCIPYPKNAKEFFIDDFVILHLERYHTQWSLDKNIYYQFVDLNKNNRSAIKLDRMYNYVRDNGVAMPLNTEWVNYEFNIFESIDLSENDFFYQQIKGFIDVHGIERYAKLNVWNKRLLTYLGKTDPRTRFCKVLHGYLNITRGKKNVFVRAIDKMITFVI